MHRFSVLKYRLTRKINSGFYKPSPILFDHIPKCAGNAVNRFLMRFYSPNVTFSLDGVHFENSVKEFKALSEKERLSYSLIHGHSANKLIDFTHPNTKILTILRDPIDRVISHYYYIKTYRSHFLHDKLINNNISLKEYCGLNLSNDLENQYTVHFSRLPLSEVRKDGNAALELALTNIIKNYDLVGFQSNLVDFFTSFSEMMQLPTRNISNNRVNTTSKRPKVDELDEATLNGIKNYNRLDIALYEKLTAIKQDGVIKKSN
jgi:hypothetical protein